MHPLAQFLNAEFEDAEKDRHDIEDRWTKNLRQFKGEYEPEIAQSIGANRSRVFVKLTRTKVISAEARLGELLFPSGDRNWGLEATPVPEAPDEVIEGIVHRLQAQAASEAIEVDEERVLHELRQWAKAGVDGMTRAIDDQLKEIDYGSLGRKIIHNACVFGTGVLKGPTNLTVTDRRLAQVKGAFQVTEREQMRPFAEVVPVWDIYPDLHAGSFREGNYVWHRHVMTKQRLQELAEREDFNGEVIMAYLKDNREGDIRELRNWESEQRQIARQDNPIAHKNRYEVRERWGVMDDVELRRLMDRQGVDGDLPVGRDIETIIWTLGDEVIKAIPNWSAMRIRPFHFFSLELDETGIFGPGLPDITEDSQTMINTATRLALDNGAVTWFPQILVDERALKAGEDPTDIYGGKVWVYDSARLRPGQDPPVQAIDIPNQIGELMGIIDLAKRQADEETAMPSLLHAGQSGDSRRTLGEESMRVGASNLVLRDIVKNFDNGITTPFITAMFHWNMQFNSDESIKRDMKVIARGSTYLVAKEVRGPAAELFAQNTMNDRDGPHINVRGLLKIRAEANDLPSDQVLLPEDQVETNERQRAEQMQAAQEREAAEADLKRANAEKARAEGERALSQAEESEAGAIERRTEAAATAFERAQGNGAPSPGP